MSIYDNYARIEHGMVNVRHSVKDEWGKRGWPPWMAREFGEHIIRLADEAERSSPKVTELAAFLESLPGDCITSEDTALALIKAGYRKKY